jgi:hypothetical protein
MYYTILRENKKRLIQGANSVCYYYSTILVKKTLTLYSLAQLIQRVELKKLSILY